jgi:hypothetical protein
MQREGINIAPLTRAQLLQAINERIPAPAAAPAPAGAPNPAEAGQANPAPAEARVNVAPTLEQPIPPLEGQSEQVNQAMMELNILEKRLMAEQKMTVVNESMAAWNRERFFRGLKFARNVAIVAAISLAVGGGASYALAMVNTPLISPFLGAILPYMSGIAGVGVVGTSTAIGFAKEKWNGSNPEYKARLEKELEILGGFKTASTSLLKEYWQYLHQNQRNQIISFMNRLQNMPKFRLNLATVPAAALP